jgi:hypothetical protein
VKKILLSIAFISGFYPQIDAFGIDDLSIAARSSIDTMMAYVNTAWQCEPSKDGIKAFCVWTYNTGKTVVSKLVKIPPQTTYQYLSARAKENPLAAVGVVTLIVLVLIAFYTAYRILYGLLYWMIRKIYSKLR